ncbi:hypothetical protein [Mesorhizobium sp. M0185]|uniref:hypothetical protein n=1 Tax=unclassified Mesorhizobium TaxID=325217 RepID=UPI00333789C0
MNSFWQETYNSFRNTYGFLFAAIALIVSLSPVFLPAGLISQVDARWLIGSVLIFVMFISIFIDMSYRALLEIKKNIEIPRIIVARENDGQRLLLLSPSNLFGIDSIVSIYHNDGDFELLCGIGRVNTIQSKGNIQVLIVKELGDKNIWKNIFGRESKSFKESIIVRPNIPYSYLLPEADHAQ